jgi:hypothetical protein
MEEAAFLRAIERDVGVVEIEHDLAWRTLMCLEKKRDQQRIDLRSIAIDLVVLRAMPLRCVFKTIERALARQSFAVRAQYRAQLPRQRCKGGILAQLVVIIEVLIPQRQAEDPLPYQCLDLMFDVARIAPVAEASGEPTHQPEAAIHLAQQQAARVRRDVATVKAGHNRSSINRFKFEQLRGTLCLHRGSPLGLIKLCSQHHFLRFASSMHCLRLRNPG